MNRLWAPWRIPYLKGPREAGCIFCDKPRESRDRENLILHRGREVFVIMNLYPYSNGHVMIVPYEHTDTLDPFTPPVVAETFELIRHVQKILIRIMKPQGFNIGINMGKPAGAGIDEHIHLHVVPRWAGDTNFMPVLGDVRVISEHIEDTYRQMKPFFEDFSRIDAD
ncbi:MAG: HIT domain-containing protein [Deltaproteobacteria bacterium]|nr:HIT domain-containing protein [Deltaproteobacteria bacterium]